MLDQQLRPVKDSLLAPFVRAVGFWLSPNAVTVLAFVLGVACAGALLGGWSIAAIVLWLLNRTFDGIDGLLSRRTKRVTDFGGYLDIVLDFVVYAAIPLALVVHAGRLDIAYAGLGLMAVFYVNAASWMYLSALLEKRGHTGARQTSILMPTGLVEGAETIVFYSLMILFPQWILGLFLGCSALTFVGAFVRFVWAARHLR